MEDSPASQVLAPQVGAGGRGAGHVGLPAVVLTLGVLGALLLVAAEFTTIARVEIPGRTCREVADLSAADRCELSGFERHGGALLLLGALAVLMAVGAARRGSRRAGLALITVATLVLGMALLRDLPEAGRTGAIGITYEGADGRAGAGLFIEIAGGLLLALAGALTLVGRPRT